MCGMVDATASFWDQDWDRFEAYRSANAGERRSSTYDARFCGLLRLRTTTSSANISPLKYLREVVSETRSDADMTTYLS